MLEDRNYIDCLDFREIFNTVQNQLQNRIIFQSMKHQIWMKSFIQTKSIFIESWDICVRNLMFQTYVYVLHSSAARFETFLATLKYFQWLHWTKETIFFFLSLSLFLELRIYFAEFLCISRILTKPWNLTPPLQKIVKRSDKQICESIRPNSSGILLGQSYSKWRHW